MSLEKLIGASLEKLIGAKFLADAQFKSVYEMPLHHQNEMNLPDDVIQKMIKSNILNGVSTAITKRFEKEIKTQKTQSFIGSVDRYELEFMAFTMPEFKHIIYFVISQMTMEQFFEIQTKYYHNATNSNL